MSLIDDFIEQYNREYDYYENHARMIASKIEEQLFKKGIKAVINYRPKSEASLREKINNNNREKKYRSVVEIFHDIKDISGIKVSLYFPLDRSIIDELMHEAFIVEKKPVFTLGKYNPRYKKRFPGYQATHYHVKLKEKNIPSRYVGTVAEIQVASILMHAWAEIDHGLVYKPSFGNLSVNELVMLDEINGWALSGEMSLKNLQHAMSVRTKKNKTFSDKYELTNFLILNINQSYFKKIRLGDIYLLQYYLETLDKTAFDNLVFFLKKINSDAQESIADQLLYMLLDKYHPADKLFLQSYFENLHLIGEAAKLAAAFISSWILLEKKIANYTLSSATETAKYTSPDFKFLAKKKILTQAEAIILENLYIIKNNVLHGMETISVGYLSTCLITLNSISVKIPARKKIL